MSFSSDSRAVSVPYVLNRLVKTVADNIKYTAPPASYSAAGTSREHTDNEDMAQSGDPKTSGDWKTKLKFWGKNDLAIEDLPDVTDDAPDASTIAHRIQTLIDQLPPPPDPSKRPSKAPKALPPARDSKGRCLPPPGSTPIKDKTFISLLSSPSVMNGEPEDRTSVWSVLEKLHAPHHHVPKEGQDEGDDEEEEDPTVMLYVPLIPTKDSTVEIATLSTLPKEPPATGDASPPPRQIGWWPWPRSPKGDAGNKPSPTPGKKPARTKEKKIWVPSKTNLSFQAFWWGYKLYLPPPVLDILNDKTIEATKRAAMITTALKWLADNIPTSAVPAPLLPALLLIQRIVPFVGYIGGFIAWSWSTVKSYDEGLGVILSATWILPVALIPGTWRASDVPSAEPDPPAPAPAPAPPAPPANDPPAQEAPPQTTARKTK